jgi:hypothetical protein
VRVRSDDCANDDCLQVNLATVYLRGKSPIDDTHSSFYTPYAAVVHVTDIRTFKYMNARGSECDTTTIGSTSIDIIYRLRRRLTTPGRPIDVISTSVDVIPIDI